MKRTEAIEQLRNVIRRQHLSLATEESYVGWIARYSEFTRKFPEKTSEERFELFLTHLAKQGVSASTQNQAFNAVLYFYRNVLKKELGGINALRAKRPQQVRTAPSVDEIRSLLQTVQDIHGYPTRLITHLLYGCGMRVSEPLNLRVKDILIAEAQLVLRGAKGGKDRIIRIPASLVTAIKQQLRFARVSWEKDSAAKVPVPLPGLLDRKYPQARLAWHWYWLFPAKDSCKHPRTGEVVRWRVHEANVQRAVKAAATKLGLMITPHILRHAYATHAIRNGASVRDIQDALGHSHINTTMGYLTPQAMSVQSPLEVL